jgi:hypothetical protein
MYPYHPETGEYISTDNPASWMLLAPDAPPPFDPQTQGCFRRGDQWEIVQSQPPIEPVPAAVTMRQARLALLNDGILPQVNAAIAAMPGTDGDAARIEWEFSGAVERNRPLVKSMGVALGLTDAQLDDLFRRASKL